MEIVSADQLSKSDQVLFQAASRARENAWAHYSNHQVGVAIRGDNSRTYVGVNVECAVMQDGITASRAAFATMVTTGVRAFETWLAVGSGAKICIPSGGDLQVAAEFASPDSLFLCSNQDGSEIRRFTFAELLPHSFNFRNLVKSGDQTPD